MSTVKLVAIGVVLAACVVGGALSRSTGPAATPTETHGNYRTCDPGWVCGSCPDGSRWGYLDDRKYTDDPQLNKLFFDDWHPCGGA